MEKDYLTWTLGEALELQDTAAEKRKVASLKRKLMKEKGISEAEAESSAIAILKANGGISKSFGTEKKKKRKK